MASLFSGLLRAKFTFADSLGKGVVLVLHRQVVELRRLERRESSEQHLDQELGCSSGAILSVHTYREQHGDHQQLHLVASRRDPAF